MQYSFKICVAESYKAFSQNAASEALLWRIVLQLITNLVNNKENRFMMIREQFKRLINPISLAKLVCAISFI
jgi:hypothetical protein